MPHVSHWAVFLGAALILLITPGPSIMYVVARAIEHGFRAAVLSSIGLALGDLLQVIATSMGLSALLASAPTVFAVLKFAGATYLVILGIATLAGKGARTGKSLPADRSRKTPSARSLVLQGFFALNPKTTLFFLAFLPQFIAPSTPVGTQMLLFGFAFVGLGFLTNSLFGWLGWRLGAFALQQAQFRYVRFAAGSILILLGAFAASAPSPHR